MPQYGTTRRPRKTIKPPARPGGPKGFRGGTAGFGPNVTLGPLQGQGPMTAVWRAIQRMLRRNQPR